MRNPPWSRDELILALDLYFKHHPSGLSAKSKEVIELSDFLRAHNPELASSLEAYRSPNSVYMKLCNFMRFDPSYTGKGLVAGAAIEESFWAEFSGNRDELTRLASQIKANR